MPDHDQSGPDDAAPRVAGVAGHLRVDPAATIAASMLRPRFRAIREELGVPDSFPSDVLAEAAALSPRGERRDRLDLELVTIDPKGSSDLDQALAIEPVDEGRRGHVVWYAIADVAAFVPVGGHVDAESRARGVTLYAPDGRAPLHPPVLSEDRASLRADGDRPAVVWRLVLDADGALVDTTVERALVRSRAQLSYEDAQPLTEPGMALASLRVVGTQRQAIERARGGVSLVLPDQSVTETADGFRLRYRTPLEVEGWNAQLSLLCGMAAAQLMLENRVGLLRTLPPAPPDALGSLRLQAAALGIAWSDDDSYADVLARLDPDHPHHAAFSVQATTLFRGAGYRPLHAADADDSTAGLVHAAIASPYAHVTAPLRRLGDRFATEAVLHAVAGRSVPDWVAETISVLPEILQAANRRASALDRAVIDLVEAFVLGSVGDRVLHGVVIDHRSGGSVVQLDDPAVVAQITTEMPLGSEVSVRAATVDLDAGRATLELV